MHQEQTQFMCNKGKHILVHQSYHTQLYKEQTQVHQGQIHIGVTRIDTLKCTRKNIITVTRTNTQLYREQEQTQSNTLGINSRTVRTNTPQMHQEQTHSGVTRTNTHSFTRNIYTQV